ALLAEMLSYCEFQLPVTPSVGDHSGKQSSVSWKEMLRTITFIGWLPPLPRMSNQAPMSVASAPAPKIVVLGGMRMRTRAACAAAEARRASSCPPTGLLRPYGPSGSNIARNAKIEYFSPVAGSGRA